MIGRVHMNERLSDVTRMLLDVSVSQKKKKNVKIKCYNKQKKGYNKHQILHFDCLYSNIDSPTLCLF